MFLGGVFFKVTKSFTKAHELGIRIVSLEAQERETNVACNWMFRKIGGKPSKMDGENNGKPY